MNRSKKIVLTVLVWLGGISVLHSALNLDWGVILNDRLPESQRKFNVAFIPVT